jgi:hypothetical protein
MAKITKATLKSMIRKNPKGLYIKKTSNFDGMYDCVMPTGDSSYTLARKADYTNDCNLGIAGVWVVGGSRNSFTEVEEEGFKGIRVYNCCGSFVLAVKNSVR